MKPSWSVKATLVAIVGTVAIVATTMGLAAWIIFSKTDENAKTVDAFYSIRYHQDNSTAWDGPNGLEASSGFTMDRLNVSQSDLMSGRFYFAGWKTGTSSAKTGTTIFNDSVTHDPHALIVSLGSTPSDGVIHLWAEWGTTVASTDVVFDITYNTNQHYRNLIKATATFNLFDLYIPPVSGKHISSFTYGGTSFSPNDQVNLTNATTFSELGSGQNRIINLTATLADNS